MPKGQDMTIGFICETYLPYSTGGAEESVEALASSLSKKGIRIIFIAPNFGSPTIRGKNIILRLFPVPFKVKKYSVLSPIFLTTIIFQLYSAFWIWYMCRREDVDLLHVHGKYMIVPTSIAQFFLRRPIVISIRDYIPLCPYGLCLFDHDRVANLGTFFLQELPQYANLYARSFFSKWSTILTGLRGWCVSQAMCFFLRRADRIVFLSSLHRSIYRNYRIDGDVIGNIVNVPKRGQVSTENINLLFIGRLSFGKGADIVLDAYKAILRTYPKSQLTFIGEGALRVKLEKTVREEKIKKRVIFTGFLERAKALKILQLANVVVLPGRWPEPFGRVAAEALLLGVPVVASKRSGWVSFIEDEKTGMLVEPNASEVERGIRKILRGQEKFRRDIQKKQKNFRRLFGEDVVDGYMRLYRLLLERRPA